MTNSPYIIRSRCVIVHDNKLLTEYVVDEDFYFYPGGRLEPFETIVQAAIREIREEIDREFQFQKVLYIREFINPDKNDHSIEFFLLGTIDNPENIDHNPDNPDPKPNHKFIWMDLDDIRSNLLPAELTEQLIIDYKENFQVETKYLGVI